MNRDKNEKITSGNSVSETTPQPFSTTTPVHFIITGGTIDSIDLDAGTTSSVSKIIPYITNTIKAYFPMSAEVAFLKDSRTITDDDRLHLLQLILNSSHRCFIVTHGSFTMAETGRFLKREICNRNVNKTVVLVGAMIAMGEPDSDAPFNLGFALAAAMTLPKGAWIAMQATAWDPDNVEKDLKLKRFKQRFLEGNPPIKLGQ